MNDVVARDGIQIATSYSTEQATVSSMQTLVLFWNRCKDDNQMFFFPEIRYSKTDFKTCKIYSDS